jgi:hypothetical protein
MSKLSRKDFKDLLTEWHNNFINERVSQTVKTSGLINNDFPIEIAFVAHNTEQNEKAYDDFQQEISDYESLGDEYQVEDKTVLVDKNIKNVKKILNLCETNEEQKQHIINSLTTDNLLIIINMQLDNVLLADYSISHYQQTGKKLDRNKYKLNMFEDNEELKSIISWAIHDLFHGYFDVVSSTNMQNLINSLSQENLVDFKGRHVSMYYGRGVDDTEFIYESGIAKELESFFNKEEFTKGVGIIDIPASVFAYSLLMIKNENDINDLGLSEITKEYFKEMYKLSTNAVSGMSLLKNKILFYHTMGS